MNGERRMKRKKITFWLIVIAVLILDRITKELAPGIPAEGLKLIPGVIGLRYAENTGVAFSLLSGVPRLTGILGLAVVAGGYLWLRKKEIAPFPLTGLAFLFTFLGWGLAKIKIKPRIKLRLLGIYFILLGCATMLIEFFIHITFSLPMFNWSLYTTIVFSALGLFLFAASFIRPLRRAMYRKMFV